MTSRIDAHQHFWRYDTVDYPWIAEDMDVLRRDWLPQDLKPLLDAAGIDGCVAVQARAHPGETDFLIDLAARHPWIRAVVGWVDLFAPDVEARLEHWSTSSRLAGFRHLLQDDRNVTDTLDDDRFNTGIRALQCNGLAYEVLVRGPEQLMPVPKFSARHDRHWLVIDHLGKPDIDGNSHAAWRKSMEKFADQAHVLCKVSGMVTETRGATPAHHAIHRHLDDVFEIFGADRMMFGSDWPVCQLRADYAQVVSIVDDWARRLSTSERAQLWGGTAARCYGTDIVVPERSPWT